MPVDIHPEEGISALNLILTKLHAVVNFWRPTPVLCGAALCGVSVVNAFQLREVCKTHWYSIPYRFEI